MSRFENILSDEIENIQSLSLLHTCDAYAFRSILEELVLKPTLCDVFKTSLLYTYYGLPSYRTSHTTPTSNPANYMICFILETENINNVSKVFPFDSGAFFKLETMKKSYFHKLTSIDDFQLTGNIDSAKKVIKTFYTSNENYLNQEPLLSKTFPILEFEAMGYNNLITSKVENEIDDRASSIEVLFDEEIFLEKRTVKQIIIPNCFKDDKIVMELIKEKFNIEPLSYRVHKGSPREYFGLLRAEYFNFLEN